MSGKVVHFELPMDNEKRATEFYKKTFGWEVQSVPEMQYTIVHTTASDAQGMPKEPGAINGGMAKRGGGVTHPVVTIAVDDIDATAKAIAKNGGTVTQPKTSIGPMGFIAYFTDTEGSTVGLYQPAAR